jgi:uncharacterized protein (DUF1800 family)
MKRFIEHLIHQCGLSGAKSASSRFVLAKAFAFVFLCAPLSLVVAQSLNATTVPSFSPLPAASWNEQRAAHLLQRAGFGGTPEQIRELAALGPRAAVRQVVYGEGMSAAQKQRQAQMAAFDPSPIDFDGMYPFPPSRPAATDAAKREGQALGILVKPEGSRPAQAITNQFFFWLRSSQLEAHRLAYWWANRMVQSEQPLVEKMALFWHGHFATSEEKVRDVRKMQQQLELFQRLGLGDFRSLMIGVAQNPAMLAYLDAGVNVKGAPNENFAREIMELFTLGIGHYGEMDIREAARAFTGWNYEGLRFVVNASQHDGSEKTVLGKRAEMDGVQVIDLLLAHPESAKFIATKIYRFFVQDEVDAATQVALGQLLREKNFHIGAFLEHLLASEHFHQTTGRQIKSPVELVVGTYRRMGMTHLPGMPDFNQVTKNLGQLLFYPPTVAGWEGGQAWITPSTLVARGNFARELLFPDLSFVAPDRQAWDPLVRETGKRINRGDNITQATGGGEGQSMAESTQMADRNEDFNTRYGAMRGFQMALQRVKPIARDAADVSVSDLVLRSGAKSTEQAVDALSQQFLAVPLSQAQRSRLQKWLSQELGTTDLIRARSYMEDSMRHLLHAMLSLPEYQLQ